MASSGCNRLSTGDVYRGLQHGYDAEPLYGETSEEEISSVLDSYMTRARNSRAEYIDACRLVYCVRGEVPPSCYRGQMELFLSYPCINRRNTTAALLFRMYREFAVEQYRMTHLFSQVDIYSVGSHFFKIYAVLNSWCKLDTRAIQCMFIAKTDLDRFKFGRGFTLEMSCVTAVAKCFISNLRISKPHLFYGDVTQSAEFARYVVHTVFKLPLPDLICAHVHKMIRGTVYPFMGREVFLSAECEVYKTLCDFARGACIL